MRFSVLILTLGASAMAAPQANYTPETTTDSPTATLTSVAKSVESFSGSLDDSMSRMKSSASYAIDNAKSSASYAMDNAKSSASSLLKSMQSSASQSIKYAESVASNDMSSATSAASDYKKGAAATSSEAKYSESIKSYQSKVQSSIDDLSKTLGYLTPQATREPPHGQIISCEPTENVEIYGACCEHWKAIVENDDKDVMLAPQECKRATKAIINNVIAWRCTEADRPFGICCDQRYKSVKECGKAKKMFGVTEFSRLERTPLNMSWTLETDLSQSELSVNGIMLKKAMVGMLY